MVAGADDVRGGGEPVVQRLLPLQPARPGRGAVGGRHVSARASGEPATGGGNGGARARGVAFSQGIGRPA